MQDGLAVTEAVRNITFEGAGRSVVALNNDGDPIGSSYEVMNYVVRADGGIGSVPVGLYNNSAEQQYTAWKRVVIWPGNMTEVPVDYLFGDPQLPSHARACAHTRTCTRTCLHSADASLWLWLPRGSTCGDWWAVLRSVVTKLPTLRKGIFPKARK